MKKDNFKEIFKYVLLLIVIIFLLIHIKEIWMVITFILKLFRPFIIGLVIAFILNILMNLIENKLLKQMDMSRKSKRVISLLISISALLAFLTIVALLIVPQLKNTVNLFIDNMPVYEENVRALLVKWQISDDVILEIEDFIQNFGDVAIEFIKNNSGEVFEVTLGLATNVISVFVNIIIALVFAIYLLAQKEKLLKGADNLLKAYLPAKRGKSIKEVFSLANKICTHFISGQCLEAIIIGCLCFLGMLILGIPYALTISVLIGVTALIPIYGAFIGTIIGAFLIFMINPIKALVFVLFIIVLQQLEGNLIYPKVVGKSVGLPGIWVFVAVTVGASLAGVIGMLISVPIASIIYNIIAIDVDKRLEERSVLRR